MKNLFISILFVFIFICNVDGQLAVIPHLTKPAQYAARAKTIVPMITVSSSLVIPAEVSTVGANKGTFNPGNKGSIELKKIQSVITNPAKSNNDSEKQAAERIVNSFCFQKQDIQLLTVRELQQALNILNGNSDLDVNGLLDEKTITAVHKYMDKKPLMSISPF